MSTTTGSLISFTEDIANAAPPPPLPTGPYPAEIIGAIKRVSGAGNEYAQIMMRIDANNYPADFTEGDPDGTTLSYNRLVIEDKPMARHRWRVFMERCGGPMGRTIDLNSLIGLTCTVEISHQEYEGEQRAQIARVLAP